MHAPCSDDSLMKAGDMSVQVKQTTAGGASGRGTASPTASALHSPDYGYADQAVPNASTVQQTCPQHNQPSGDYLSTWNGAKAATCPEVTQHMPDQQQQQQQYAYEKSARSSSRIPAHRNGSASSHGAKPHTHTSKSSGRLRSHHHRQARQADAVIHAHQVNRMTRPGSQIERCPFCRHVFVNSLELAKHFTNRCPRSLQVFLYSAPQLLQYYKQKSQENSALTNHHQRIQTHKYVPVSENRNFNPIPTMGSRAVCSKRCVQDGSSSSQPVCNCPCARSNSVTSFCPYTPAHVHRRSVLPKSKNKESTAKNPSPVDHAIRDALLGRTGSSMPNRAARAMPISYHADPEQKCQSVPPGSLQGVTWQGSRSTLLQPPHLHPAINHPAILKQVKLQPKRPPNHAGEDMPVVHPSQVLSSAETLDKHAQDYYEIEDSEVSHPSMKMQGITPVTESSSSACKSRTQTNSHREDDDCMDMPTLVPL
ncbi:uncharacterized protein LOC135830426 [Sycon ciliatum]|uniref:uncharacterized protein LOC135830426 n=1 Tax=Sycon ciliatum TaxID=27933 RepID=UPI0031F6329E